ncbi:MAG: haloacid dehalogenase type II, partial [Nocardioidaceae bacterium]
GRVRPTDRGAFLNLTDYDALSFDCYGTLIDWEAGIGSVLRDWAGDRGVERDLEELLTAYAGHEARTARENPAMLYPDVLADSFQALGDELGVAVSSGWAARLGSSVPQWPAFPDSHEALRRLQGRYRLIILSNVDRKSFEGSRERLDVAFDYVLTAEDVGSYKPSPRNFEALDVLRPRIGISEGKLLHVAQSLFHDHVPAKGIGMDTVWINRRHDRPGWGATPEPGAEVQPDWEFPSMAAFADAVEAMA